MKTLFKLIFYVFGIACISIISIYAVWYIDKNNLTESILSNVSLETAALFPDRLLEGRVDFLDPRDTRPIAMKISDKKDKNVEYQYIYPSQIFYASANEVKLLFRDSVFTITNNLGLKKIKDRLNNKKVGSFMHTQSYVINRAAIIGVSRKGLQTYNYSYHVQLVNGEELAISKDIYKKMTESIELATEEHIF